MTAILTGEGYQPFEEEEFWGDDLAAKIVAWFKERLDAYGQLTEDD